MAKPKKPASAPSDETEEGAEPAPLVAEPKGQDRFAAILKSSGLVIAKRNYGGSITLAGNMLGKVKRIPTGAYPVDLALNGGFPAGLVHHLYGPKASGKTTSALMAVGAAQKLCSNCFKFRDPEAPACGCADGGRETVCAWIDQEGTLDTLWATRLGVDPSRLLCSTPSCGEEASDQIGSLLRTGLVDYIVLDSIAFMQSQSEGKKAADEADVASQARVVHRLIRTIVNQQNYASNTTGRRPTVTLLNQTRNKVGVVFGNPETTAGGNGPGYAAALELRFSPVKFIKNPKDEGGDPLYNQISCTVEKNKLAPAKREFELRLALKNSEVKKVGQVMDEYLMVQHGQNLGLIEGGGSSYSLFGEVYRGKVAIELALSQNAALKRKVQDALLQIQMV